MAENVARTKDEYIEAWKNYVLQLRILQFNPDIELGRRISKLIDELLVCVDKTADEKYGKGEN